MAATGIALRDAAVVVGSGAIDSSIVAPAIVAAIVAAAVALTTFALAGRRARLDRQRQLFADAFEVVAEYGEYPFIVRRRNKDAPGEERTRISSELSKVQARLNSYRARLLVEAPHVGARYAELIDTLRNVAGPMIREAWNKDPVAADDQMHAPALDFSRLDTCEEQFLEAVADHLAWMYTPIRQGLRKAQRGVRRSKTRTRESKACLLSVRGQEDCVRTLPEPSATIGRHRSQPKAESAPET